MHYSLGKTLAPREKQQSLNNFELDTRRIISYLLPKYRAYVHYIRVFFTLHTDKGGFKKNKRQDQQKHKRRPPLFKI